MEKLMKMTTWPEEELVRELWDDESPLFINDYSYSNPSSNINDPLLIVNDHQDISDSNSSPIIGGVSESALSFTSNFRINHSEDLFQARSSSMLERGVCKGESKYTLQIKSCGNVMADDGYKWRKYGQKSIKNSSNPRSYYKCTNPRCSAKKQVQRSTDDPDTFIITYEGLHLHFTYPFFSLGQPDPSSKRAKVSSPKAQDHEQEDQQVQEEECPQNIGPSPSEDAVLAQQEVGSQGLLEDIVPIVIRNPQINTSCCHSSSSSSCPSPPTSPPSFSWSSFDYSPLSFDIGL